jgi:hypothetical protein
LAKRKLATAVRKCGHNGQHVKAENTAQSIVNSVMDLKVLAKYCSYIQLTWYEQCDATGVCGMS